MSFLSILATIFGSAMAISNFPQALKIFRRRSAKDISIITFSILLVGAIVWVLYGIEIKSIPIIFSNSLGTIGVTFVMVGWFLYGRDS